jgi:hypothetical protein
MLPAKRPIAVAVAGALLGGCGGPSSSFRWSCTSFIVSSIVEEGIERSVAFRGVILRSLVSTDYILALRLGRLCL